MTRSLARFTVLLTVAAAPAFAQTTAPASSPAPSAPAQTASAPVQTIKASAKLVVVDVVVTDSHHKPVQIHPAGIAFLHNADGKIHGDFEIVIFAFTGDGELVNSLVSTVHVVATLDQLKLLFKEGIFRHEDFSTPAKGDYFLRIAVHDLHRDHYGAVEVATSSVRNVVLYTPPPPSLIQK